MCLREINEYVTREVLLKNAREDEPIKVEADFSNPIDQIKIAPRAYLIKSGSERIFSANYVAFFWERGI